MDLGFLDNIWQGIGNIGADTDKFMKREMPFDSGWGAPAALVAAIAAPEIIPTMGEAGATAGEGGSLLGSGGMNGLLDTLGVSGGGDFVPTAGNSFDLGGGFGNLMTSDPTSFGEGWNATGFNDGTGYSAQQQGSLDNLINEQSAKYPMDAAKGAGKPTFQQLLGKQLMSGNLGSSMGQRGSFQHQDQPVQRQQAFAATPAPFQVQNKDSDIAALIAALKKKDLG